MAEVLGALSLLDKALPTGVDGTRLAEWSMRDGITYGELANRLALALADANAEFVSKWGWLFFITEELAMEYANGGSVTPMPELTDVDRPTARKATTIGHMIELRNYGDAIGGTRHYFRDIRSAQIAAAISVIVNSAKWRFEQLLLNRIFSNAETAIGTGGYNVPFVRGTGGNVDFAPPAYEGEAFDTSHNHYLGYATGSSKTLADQLNGLAETLQEHGHEPPFDALCSRADIATYAGLTDFVQIIDIQGFLAIDRGAESSGNQFYRTGDRTMGHFGDYQSDYGLIRLHSTARIPTTYTGMVKSYGQLDGRNPLAVRVHPDVGFGIYVAPETLPNDDIPIKQLDVYFELGVGVGMDRTNGAASELDDGNYGVPEIS